MDVLLEQKVQDCVRNNGGVPTRRSAAPGTGRQTDEWALRAALLAGEGGLLNAAEQRPVSVNVTWPTAMGVRYPDHSGCSWPTDQGRCVPSSAAQVSACQAYHRALEAAVHQAATDAASQAFTTTNRRVRVLRRRWIPALRDELARVELTLEELDRAPATTRRLAAR